MNPEAFSEAAEALRTLSRTMTRMYPKPVVDGSQHQEDLRLEQLLPDPVGLYVDVGSSWPRCCSNTIRFYDKGWHGLLIDPLPEVWGAILLERPEDYLCPIACSSVDGFAQLKVCRSMSSLREDWPTDSTEFIPVRTERLETILKRYTAVEWDATELLSIDVEGAEKDVLEGVPWGWFRPTVVIVEFADPSGIDISAPWRPILDVNYVSHWRGSLNEIFRRK